MNGWSALSFKWASMVSENEKSFFNGWLLKCYNHINSRWTVYLFRILQITTQTFYIKLTFILSKHQRIFLIRRVVDCGIACNIWNPELIIKIKNVDHSTYPHFKSQIINFFLIKSKCIVDFKNVHINNHIDEKNCPCTCYTVPKVRSGSKNVS